MAKKFKLRLKQIDGIEIEDVDGTVIPCVLRELAGHQRDTYIGKSLDRVKLGSDGKPTTIRNMAGFQIDLIAMSLYKVVDEQPFSPASINQWPASVQSELFKMAQELSGLTNEAKTEEDAKND